MQKLIRLTISLLLIAASGSLVYAQTVTPTPTPPNQLSATLTADNQNHTLAGSDSSAGDTPSFDVSFVTDQIPANAKVEQAILSYTQHGTSSGLVKIIDKYSTSILDSKGLGTSDVPISSDRLKDSVQGWLSNPNQNLGLLFQASDLGATDDIQFVDIIITVTYVIPDTTPPVINTISVTQTTNSSAIIKVETDEPAVFTINFGKTSLYDKSVDFKASYLTSEELNLTNLQGGVGYHYQVVASDTSGNSSKSNDSTFTTILQSGNVLGDSTENIDPNLGAPTNLNVELTRVDNKYTANLAWTAAPGDIDGYVIYRGFESLDDIKEYKRVGQVSNFIDTDVLEEHSYYYYVRAYKANSLSVKSDNAAILVPKVPADQNAITSLFNSTDTRVQLVLILFAAAGVILCIYYLLYKGTKGFISKFGPKPKRTNVLKDPDFYK